jgi:hypothetical protein
MQQYPRYNFPEEVIFLITNILLRSEIHYRIFKSNSLSPFCSQRMVTKISLETFLFAPCGVKSQKIRHWHRRKNITECGVLRTYGPLSPFLRCRGVVTLYLSCASTQISYALILCSTSPTSPFNPILLDLLAKPGSRSYHFGT